MDLIPNISYPLVNIFSEIGAEDHHISFHWQNCLESYTAASIEIYADGKFEWFYHNKIANVVLGTEDRVGLTK